MPSAVQKIGPASMEPARGTPDGRYADWNEFRSTSPAVQKHLMELATRPLPDLQDEDLVPIPGEAPDAEQVLGPPLASISVSGDNWWANRIVGWFFFFGPCLGILAGISLISLGGGGPDDGAGLVFVSLIYGLPFMCLGAWLSFFRRLRLPTTIWVCEGGLLRKRGRTFRICTWEDIDDFHISEETARPYYYITIQGKETEIALANHFGATRLMDYIEIKLSTAKLLPMLQRLYAGEGLKFYSVTLDRGGFAGPRFYVEWSEVDVVEADSLYINVIDSDSRRHRVRQRDVSFPLLLITLANIMMGETDNLGSATD
jgi:hypothetical protein